MDDIDHIKRIAKEAGDILVKYYNTDVEINHKRDEYDPVTTADLEADKFIQAELKKKIPQDQILSEENKQTPQDFSGRVWIIDPMDGTRSFIQHEDSFCAIIGLAIDGVPTLGVVYHPLRKQLWWAEKGKGAFLNGEKLQVSMVDDLSEATMPIRKQWQQTYPLTEVVENLSVKERIHEHGAGTKMCMLAKGEADFWVVQTKLMAKWDTCGTQVILEEAGGKVTNIDGEPLNYHKKTREWEEYVVASNSIIHEKVVQELQRLIKR